MVLDEGCALKGKLGTFRSDEGRRFDKEFVQIHGGPNRVHPDTSLIPWHLGVFYSVLRPRNRNVRFTNESLVPKVCDPPPTPRGLGRGRPQVPTDGTHGSVRSPTMDDHRPVAGQTQSPPGYNMSPCGSLLGFRRVVAPINEDAYSKNTLSSDTTQLGYLPGFPREVHARAKMAPELHNVIRKILAEQKIQNANIEDFMAKKSR